MEHKFKLGVRLRDKVTLFEGIATSRIEYLNGCIQYGIKPGLDKDGKTQEAHWFDEDQIEQVNEGITESIVRKKQAPGGENLEHPLG